MKQGKPVINLVMLALAAALAVYFSVYLINSLNTPYTTTLAYEYTYYDSAQAEGLLVREETVLPPGDGIVDVQRSEGERVGKGQTVALVYRDSQAQSDQASLEAMKVERELLRYSLAQSGDVEAAARLDETIIQSAVELRSAAARRDYSHLEDQVVEVKSAVLQRGYTYGDGVTAQDLKERVDRLDQEIAALTRQSSGDVTRVQAGKAGTYSSLVDGMETLVTPANMWALSPEQLRSLLDTGVSPDPDAVGKLITSERWYFAALIPSEAAQRLKVGEYATVRFTGDFDQDVAMRVDQVGELADSSQQVAIFSSDRYLARTTLLRQQSAELIFDHYSGLRVPKGAVRMVKDTVTDPDTGLAATVSRLGVYVIVAGRTEFKQVEMVTEGSDYYVVAPTQLGPRALRAGDEVIINALDLSSDQQLRE